EAENAARHIGQDEQRYDDGVGSAACPSDPRRDEEQDVSNHRECRVVPLPYVSQPGPRAPLVPMQVAGLGAPRAPLSPQRVRMAAQRVVTTQAIALSTHRVRGITPHGAIRAG